MSDEAKFWVAVVFIGIVAIRVIARGGNGMDVLLSFLIRSYPVNPNNDERTFGGLVLAVIVAAALALILYWMSFQMPR